MDDNAIFPEPQRGNHSNRLATIGLVVGVLSICGGLLAIPGIICNFKALAKSRMLGGNGRSKAIKGMILSIVGLVIIAPLTIVLGFHLFVGYAERKIDKNNYKQVWLGLNCNEAAYGDLPLTVREVPNIEFENRLSWRVDILPYLFLRSDFKHNEPWDSPHNAPLANQTIRYYSDRETPTDPTTRMRIFYGNGAVFDPARPMTTQDIPDGASNTILVVEGGEKVTWTRFQEYKFDPNADLPPLGKPQNNYFIVIMADGSVRNVRKSVNPQTLKSAIHASDGIGGLND